MSEHMTEGEWQGLQATLVRGGLREYVDRLIDRRLTTVDCPPISDANRALLYRAYDDGDGRNIEIISGTHDGYFVGVWDGTEVMEGTEINGVLYSVCPQSGGGLVAVLVGDEIVNNEVGQIFHSHGEARAYIKGLTNREQNAQ